MDPKTHKKTIFLNALFFPLSVWGFKMRSPTWDRLLNLYLHKLGMMGCSEKKIFEKHIKPGMSVLDVGANQGLYALLISRLVGVSGRVYAFEPSQILFKALQRNLQANNAKNVEAYKIALGDVESTMTLHSSLLNYGDNRLSSRPFVSHSEKVAVKRFDDVFPNLRVDFLKVDVQGWERHVFAGMEKLLEKSEKPTVLFEFCKIDLERAQTQPIDLLYFLQGNGFTFFVSDSQSASSPAEIIQQTTWKAYINILAKRL